MLKYLYAMNIFQEVPDEVSLGIGISGCQIRCKGCHSRELWEDKGTPLTIRELKRLIDKNRGITCVCLFGGEHSIDELIALFKSVPRCLKTAWYSGLDMVPRDKTEILRYLDFIKLGHFDMELGGLASPTTNQRLYTCSAGSDFDIDMKDITYKLQRKKNED